MLCFLLQLHVLLPLDFDVTTVAKNTKQPTQQKQTAYYSRRKHQAADAKNTGGQLTVAKNTVHRLEKTR